MQFRKDINGLRAIAVIAVMLFIEGDSHADALTTAVAYSVNLTEEGIIALTMSGCPFVLNSMSTIEGDACYKENILRIEYLESSC